MNLGDGGKYKTMKNNDELKRIASKTKDLKYLTDKDIITYNEYMLLCCTDEWQKSFIKNLEYLKSVDSKNWY